MKKVKCRTFSKFDCGFEIDGSDYEMIKKKMKTHLEEVHFPLQDSKKYDNKLKLREIIQKIDTVLNTRPDTPQVTK